jgi:signal transduction histidine kinase
VALWSDGQCRYTREPAGTFGPLVAGPLAGTDFLCLDLLAPNPTILYSSASSWQQWQGQPLNPELRERFSPKTVLSLTFHGQHAEGRLLGLDKVRMNSGDLVLGAIVARDAAYKLDHFYLLKQLQQAAATEERVRLARDLHDGLLQSLAAAALQLETVHRMMETEPQTARQRLAEVQRMISAEQRNLRSHIHQLKLSYEGPPESREDLEARLRELADRIEHQWGHRVQLEVKLHQRRLPWDLAQGVYFIVHEALNNAVRHAQASHIAADISSEDRRLHIVIVDNGNGFPFHGHHDHAELTAMNLGPLTLRERIASLGGELTIDSGDTGARLEISLPIEEKEG